jgi:hypothetical protein
MLGNHHSGKLSILCISPDRKPQAPVVFAGKDFGDDRANGSHSQIKPKLCMPLQLSKSVSEYLSLPRPI